MKKIYTLLVIALLVPAFALAAPKQRVTLVSLKKQVITLLNENKALKAEIQALKAQKPVQQTLRCADNQVLLSEPVTNQTQTITTMEPTRLLKLNATPVTDGVEVNGLETITSVRFQIQSTLDTDTIELTGATILDQYNEGGGKIFILSPESASVTLTINGNVTNTNIVVDEAPDRSNNSNKRVYMTGEFYANA